MDGPRPRGVWRGAMGLRMARTGVALVHRTWRENSIFCCCSVGAASRVHPQFFFTFLCLGDFVTLVLAVKKAQARLRAFSTHACLSVLLCLLNS